MGGGPLAEPNDLAGWKEVDLPSAGGSWWEGPADDRGSPVCGAWGVGEPSVRVGVGREGAQMDDGWEADAWMAQSCRHHRPSS